MSLIPAFQIGLWNARILIALNFSTSMLASLINKEGVARAMGTGENAPQSSRTQKIVLLNYSRYDHARYYVLLHLSAPETGNSMALYRSSHLFFGHNYQLHGRSLLCYYRT